ncbi:MAG: hypothetical protein ACOC7J_07160, partial [Armatimonadota bacterium]
EPIRVVIAEPETPPDGFYVQGVHPRAKGAWRSREARSQRARGTARDCGRGGGGGRCSELSRRRPKNALAEVLYEADKVLAILPAQVLRLEGP